MQSYRKLARHVLAAIVTVILISCSSPSVSLTNTEILATADAIRAQTPTAILLKLVEGESDPTPTDRPSLENKVIEQENQVTETSASSVNINAIQWNEVASHTGESTNVCGPVVSTRYASATKGAPTFINLGADYPDPKRVTIVIWSESRANFIFSPETAYLNRTLCVAGAITLYRGVAQIEVSNPTQLTFK